MSAPQVGVLRYVGYTVGVTGHGRSDRHQILQRVFECELPLVKSAEYMAEWGRPNSTTRLKKIADSIVYFCHNAMGRQRANMRRAIENYRDDLDWLKTTFYNGNYEGAFPWPDI